MNNLNEETTTMTRPPKDMVNFMILQRIDNLESFLSTGLEFGNSTKYLFASATVCSQIDSIARGQLRTLSGDDTYGLHITEYMSTHGSIYIINNKKVFKLAPWNTQAVLLDMPYILGVQLRPTTLMLNCQNPELDAIKHQYITEYTIKFKLEKQHAVWWDIATI